MSFIDVKNPLISIIVPTRNEAGSLPRLLKSISKLEYPKSKVELIIVDGVSADGTVKIAKRFRARIFSNPGVIRSTGCQIGVKQAKGELVAFTDADCIVPKNWLKELFKYLQSDDQIAGVGGPNLTPKNDSPFAKAVGEVVWLLTRFGARYGFFSDKAVEIYHNPGCNVLYRKEAIQKVGGFDERLLTCEDEELDFRLRQSGYKLLFTPSAVVDHYRRPSYKKIFIQAFRYAKGRFQTIRIHRQMAKWFHVVPSFFILSQLISLISLLAIPSLQMISVSYLLFSVSVFLTISIFLSLTRGYVSPIAYLLILYCWIYGWGFGFIFNGVYIGGNKKKRSDVEVRKDWADYWQRYRGVTRVGAWSQKQALKEALLVIENNKVSKHAKVIDMGCGEGRTLNTLRDRGFKNSIGIDNTEESLRLCRKSGLKVGRDVFMRDAIKTGYRKGEFDVLFSEGLLEHFEDPTRIIAEMARSSRKFILLIQPNHYSVYGWAISVLGRAIRNNMKEYPFEKEYFVNKFNSFGFSLKSEGHTLLNEFYILLFKKD